MRNAILIDYKYCTGCHTCEVACQKALGLGPDQFGMKLTQIGPDEYEPRKWQYEFFPVPTDRCNRCVDRAAKGKLPSCELHCQAGCIRIGPAEELVKDITSEKHVLFA